MRCLVDTGAQVSTLTETFYREHFDTELMDVSTYIKITAANGLDIPYVGYFEPTVEIMGHKLRVGFLVVQDPPSSSLTQRKIEVPGVIGSNIIRILREEVDGDESMPGVWEHFMSLYSEEVYEVGGVFLKPGFVKLNCDVMIPARSVKQVQASVTPAERGCVFNALVERHDVAVRNLPAGMAIGRSCVREYNTGKVPVQVANFGDKDIYLRTRSIGRSVGS